jgi:transposase
VVPFHRRHEERIRAAVAERPGLTLEQLRARLGLDVGIGTLWEALRKLRITFKKRPSTRPNNSGRTSPFGGPSSTSSAGPASTQTA